VDAGGLRDRALDHHLDDVVVALHRGAVGLALPEALAAEPAALRAYDAPRRVAVLDEQRLDALLVDGDEHVGQPARGAPVRAEGLREALQRLCVALSAAGLAALSGRR